MLLVCHEMRLMSFNRTLSPNKAKRTTGDLIGRKTVRLEYLLPLSANLGVAASQREHRSRAPSARDLTMVVVSEQRGFPRRSGSTANLPPESSTTPGRDIRRGAGTTAA